MGQSTSESASTPMNLHWPSSSSPLMLRRPHKATSFVAQYTTSAPWQPVKGKHFYSLESELLWDFLGGNFRSLLPLGEYKKHHFQ